MRYKTTKVLHKARLKAGLILCCLWFTVPSFAKDVGIILSQTPEYEGYDAESIFSYSGTVSPWFSSPLGEKADFYLSGAFTLKYDYTKNDQAEEIEWSNAPELLRTELDLRPVETLSLKLGRVYYTDPLGLVAEGLFDGFQAEIDAGEGILSLGGYYTGFLYKKNINITFTMTELDEYNSAFKYDDFLGTYFAPRRAMASLGWEQPLGDVRFNMRLLGQFDCNGRESAYHSQYLIAKVGIPYKNRFLLEAGAAAELIETTSQPVRVGLAGDLVFSFMPPTSIQDQLSLGGRWASGLVEGSPVIAFTPVTTEGQGHILRGKFSGLSSVTLAYTARLYPAFSFILDASYFVRNDLESYLYWPVLEPSYLLGGEAYAQFIWSPLSDLRFTLGGGAFFPSLGDTNSGAKPRWQVQLNILLALL